MMKKSEGGYTLIEIMAVAFLMALLAAAIIPVLQQSQKYFLKIRIRNEITASARQTIDTVQRFLHQADRRTIVITTPTGTPPNSRIEFQMRDGRAVVFSCAGKKVFFRLGNTTTELADRVTALSFAGDSSDMSLIYVTLQVDHVFPNGDRETTFLPNQLVRIAQP